MKQTIQNKKNRLVQLLILVFMSASVTFGQTKEMDMVAYIDNAALIFLLLVLIIFIVLFFSHEKTESEKSSVRKPALSKLLYNKLVDAAPVEKEKDILLDHDYDGIRELDNNLPPWWKYLFYVTIIFAVVYMLDYHVFHSGKLQEAEYLE
ncbi:MAG: hypothetical protein M0P61_11000, partial [Ignavibacteriaceae bacterium]|nr:hypothetical protein [Ignavibacteriaceae bacterium]